MSLSIQGLSRPSFVSQVKPRQNNTQNTTFSHNRINSTPQIALAQKASVMPAISFGSLKEIALAKQFDAIIAKYSKGENPLILNAKDGFSRKIAHRITSEPNKPLIIGVTGQSASGKSTLLDQAKKAIGEGSYRIIHGDNYYHDTAQKRIDEGGLATMFRKGFSFDKPDAVELDLLNVDLKKLSNGESITKLSYDFCNGARTVLPEKIQPAKIIIVDSIFALNKKVNGALDTGIYVQSSPDVIKERFFKRAIEERNKNPEEAVLQYADVTEKAQEHIVPTAQNAGLILSGEAPLEKSQEFFKDINKLFN